MIDIFKNKVRLGQVGGAKPFEKTHRGFRLFVRLTGVNFDLGESIRVEPVLFPLIDVERAGAGWIIQVGRRRPEYLIIVAPFRLFKIEKVEDEWTQD